jgi:hypothetical protein
MKLASRPQSLEIRDHLCVLAQLGPDGTYELGRTWTIAGTNQWGPRPTVAFVRAGRPIPPSAARPKP